MANEKETVSSIGERQLIIMKRYLPFVVIAGLTWWTLRQNETIEKMRQEHNEHLQHDIDFARDAYQKSADAYLLMVKKQNDEKENQR